MQNVFGFLVFVLTTSIMSKKKNTVENGQEFKQTISKTETFKRKYWIHVLKEFFIWTNEM